MRDPLREGLREFLQSTGRLEMQRLGPETKARREASKEELARLQAVFQGALRFQTRMQVLCTLLLCVILIFQAGLLVYGLSSGNPLIGAAGGVAFVLVPVVWRLRRLGIDRFVTGMLVRALPDLSPREAIRLAEVSYWAMVAPEGRGLSRRASGPRHRGQPGLYS